MATDPTFEVRERAAGTAPNAAESAHFCSIDEMQAATEAEGWEAQYNQIQSGRLKVSTYSRDYSDLSLMDETADRCIELVGQTPAGCISLLAPCAGTEIWVNGRTLHSEQIVLLNPGASLQCLTRENTQVLSMHIPIAALDETGSELLNYCLQRTGNHTAAIDIGGIAGRSLRRMMRLALYAPIAERWAPERTAELTRELVQYCRNTTGRIDDDRCRLQPLASARTIARARDYIESHLDQAMPMSNVCAHAAVSLSKLERTFMKELGLTPHAYICARRLAAVRHELQNTSPEQRRVADAAMDYGFNHLGRFAGVYRQQFGELPSETLRAR